MSKLFIVCGLPGSGKTSFSNELSKKLNIACVGKDTIKEILLDCMDFFSAEESKKAGQCAINLVYELAKDHLQNNVDLIIESTFQYDSDFEAINSWHKQENVEIFTLVCFISEEERKKRFSQRIRHKGHLERDKQFFLYDLAVYDRFPGKKIMIETNKSVEAVVSDLVRSNNLESKSPDR